MRSLLPLLLIPLPLTAQEAPELVFPVDCTLGETCMIQQFLDRDPGPGARDFRCGPMSYDDHGGTDIRLPDMAALAPGTAVLAAAPGIVRGARDGVPDTGAGGFPAGQDCGNGVIIDHENGWQTQYCHMAEGSVSVVTGAVVEAGQRIGMIGFSGDTEFPHLHFSLRLNGADVDPFDPSDTATCGVGATPLWAETIPADPGGILSVGFAAGIPDYQDVRNGQADAQSLRSDAPALVIWAYLHNGRAGDTVELSITGPDGAPVHRQEVTLDATQAQLFRASGRRTPEGGWATGVYRGEVQLIRAGEVLDSATTDIQVTAATP